MLIKELKEELMLLRKLMVKYFKKVDDIGYIQFVANDNFETWAKSYIEEFMQDMTKEEFKSHVKERIVLYLEELDI